MRIVMYFCMGTIRVLPIQVGVYDSMEWNDGLNDGTECFLKLKLITAYH